MQFWGTCVIYVRPLARNIAGLNTQKQTRSLVQETRQKHSPQALKGALERYNSMLTLPIDPIQLQEFYYDTNTW